MSSPGTGLQALYAPRFPAGTASVINDALFLCNGSRGGIVDSNSVECRRKHGLLNVIKNTSQGGMEKEFRSDPYPSEEEGERMEPPSSDIELCRGTRSSAVIGYDCYRMCQ